MLEDLPENVKAYFEQNEIKRVLTQRSDYNAGQPHWVIFRVSRDKLIGKVAWQKIAKFIEATYIPSEHEDERLGCRKIIVDSSVYFIGIEDTGLEIAGLLNSTPAKVYSGTYVNRTGAAYCQFFAWVIGLVPTPKKLVEKHAKELAKTSQHLHKVKGRSKDLISKLDEITAALYGLSEKELADMQSFFDFFVEG